MDTKKMPFKISAASNSDTPIAIRSDSKEGRRARERLISIAKSPHNHSSDWAELARYAIEFTARCLTEPSSFVGSPGDQLTEEEVTAILEQALAARNSTTQAAAPLGGETTESELSEQRDTIFPSRNYDYTAILRGSREVWLVFNDMYNWLGNHGHRKALEERMRSNELKTNIFLIHPESPALDYIAAKSNKLDPVAKTGDNRQLYDIKRSLFRLLENVIDDIGDKTRIVGHQWVHAYSMVMDEAEAYVTPYLNKRVGNDGIIHVYRSEFGRPTAYMYRDLRDDMEDMVRYTTRIPSLNLVKYMKEHREFMNPELYAE